MELRENTKSCNINQGLIISHSHLTVIYKNDTRVIQCSLVSRPSPFLPSICIHNNQSSAPVYYCERKRKVKMGELGVGTRLHTVVVCNNLLILTFGKKISC